MNFKKLYWNVKIQFKYYKFKYMILDSTNPLSCSNARSNDRGGRRGEGGGKGGEGRDAPLQEEENQR